MTTGGRRPEQLDVGHYYEPTLLDVPDNRNAATQDEIFGPMACVIGYDDVAEAVTIANDLIFGLAGMVHGDTNHATTVARQIRAGTVWVNAAAPSGYAPFGGYKQSGIGREMDTTAYASTRRSSTSISAELAGALPPVDREGILRQWEALGSTVPRRLPESSLERRCDRAPDVVDANGCAR